MKDRDRFKAVVLVNSFPKSGTNFVEEFLKCNEILPAEISISPTRYIGRKKRVANCLPSALFSKERIDIGYELESSYPAEVITRKIGSAKGKGRYITGHIAHSDGVASLLRRSQVKHIFIIRHPIDVLYSYWNYVQKNKTHVLYQHALLNGPYQLLLDLMYGADTEHGNLRPWDYCFDRAAKWAEVTDSHLQLIKYEEMIGDKTLHHKVSDFLGVRLIHPFSDVFGEGKTFREGGVSKWRKDLHFASFLGEKFCADLDEAWARIK